MYSQELIDAYNATGYDASRDDEMCPERKVYSGSRDEYYRYSRWVKFVSKIRAKINDFRRIL